jgi:single-strand DNA-binding protein
VGSAAPPANSGGVNSVNLIGRLVDDPVARTAPDGEEQCALRLAVPRVGDGGLREPGVVYVEVVVRGLRALDLLEQVRGGARIGVSGRLELDEWTEDDGQQRARYEVLADQLEVLDAPADAAA